MLKEPHVPYEIQTKKGSKHSEVISTMSNPNQVSVWSGTDAAVREQQNQGFGQSQGKDTDATLVELSAFELLKLLADFFGYDGINRCSSSGRVAFAENIFAP